MSIHKKILTVLTVLAGILVFPAGSLAANGHGLVNSFGGSTSTVPDPEPLSDPTGIAVDEKTGEVYVLETSSNRVERFSTSGSPLGSFNGSTVPVTGVFSEPNGIAVDNDLASESYGDVYVSDAGHGVVDKFKRGTSGEIEFVYQLTGGPSGSFGGTPSGVSVDPSGDPWVYGSEGHANEFNNSEQNVSILQSEPGISSPGGIAAGSNATLYVIIRNAETGATYLQKYHGTGTEEFEGNVSFACGCVTGVAVDPANNHVYVDQGKSVAEYGEFGLPLEEPLNTFGSRAMQGGTGIAVSAAGLVYVADSTANDVDVFEEGPKPTTPITEKAQPVEGVSATLKGKLEGGETSYQFAYNTNGTCQGENTHTTPVVTATSSEGVSVKLTGLTAKTKYTYCLTDENKYGQETGAPETFETTPSAPVIEKTGSTVNRVTVSLSASVNPELETSTCVFQYGTSETYGQETPCEETGGAIGNGSTPVPVTATLKGLEPNTTYDYRVLATNGAGRQTGPNETFTTEVITPIQVETAAALDVTPTSAKLGGQVNPQGGATYYIEYGAPACSLNGKPNYVWWLCATKTTEQGPLTGNTLQTVTPFQVTGLTPGTTYKYWIVAHNKNGSERGEEATFTTPALPTSLPQVVGVTPAIVAPQIVPPAILPAPKITITAASVKGNTLNVIVRTTVAGTVTITGAGLPKTTKTLAAGTHQVTISLKNRKKHSKHKKITLQVTLKAAGTSARATKTIKL